MSPQPKQESFNPMYFPPPPTSSSTTTNSKKQKPMKLTFSKQRDSTETSSSSTSRVPLPKTPKPILKNTTHPTKRTRQWLLLSLLVSSFIILILSVIFAYCAALPHSENPNKAIESASPGLSTATETGTLSPTTSTLTVLPATAEPTTSSTSSSTTSHTLPRRDTTDTSPIIDDYDYAAALATDRTNHAKFTTPSATASLTIYTAFLPLLTILHTSAELLISLARPQTSQSTRFGDLLRGRSDIEAGTRPTPRRAHWGPRLSFATSTVLVLGWVVMQSFWMNCEISTRGNQGLCPVQIRGHRMGGVDELSVAKVVFAFLVLIFYAVYLWFLVAKVQCFRNARRTVVLRNGEGGRVSGFRRKARFAGRGEAGKEDDTNEVETVVVGMSFGKETR